jgi:hypothetical protein
MIKIHSNIIIGNFNDLQLLLPNVSFIINCFSGYSYLYNNPNFINVVNLEYNTFLQLYNFINYKILLNNNIFILCDTGKNISLIIGMFFLMKYHNLNFNTVYYNIAYYNHINSYEYYSNLISFEPYILSPPQSNNMEIS